MKKQPGPSEEGQWCTAKKVTLLIFSNVLQRDLQAFTRVTVHWGKGNTDTFWVFGSEMTLIPEDSRHSFGPLWFHFGHTKRPMEVRWSMEFNSGPSHSGPRRCWLHMWLFPQVWNAELEQTYYAAGRIPTLFLWAMKGWWERSHGSHWNCHYLENNKSKAQPHSRRACGH